MRAKKWEALHKGDVIDLVAPASACTMAEIRASIKVVEKWGFVPRLPKNIFNGDKLLANTDAVRFQQFKKAIESKTSKAVWCVRGGYGGIRLLPQMKSIRPTGIPKVLLGYSDITTLHAWADQKWGWPTLHSPLFDRLGTGKLAVTQMRRLEKILKGELQEVSFSKLQPVNKLAKKVSKIQSPIVGGNMVTWLSHTGTALKTSSRGRFLFLEEIGERPHKIDRMLTQLEQTGALKGCKGVVLGDFLVAAADKRLLWDSVVPRFAEASDIPVFKGLPVGHGKIQRTLPLNTKATLFKTSKGFQLDVATGVQ